MKKIITSPFFLIYFLFSISVFCQEETPENKGRKSKPFLQSFSNQLAAAPAGSISVAENATYNAMSAEGLVKDLLVTGCLKASNVKFGYYSLVSGTWVWTDHPWAANAGDRQLAQFSKGSSTFPLQEGLAMITGSSSTAMGPNTVAGSSSQKVNSASDPDLAAITGQIMRDAAVLEFDFVPAGNTLEFKYIFTSEEYIEYCETQFNDAFGFFLSGPGIAGPYRNNAVNLATLPGNIPVSINTIHPAGTNVQLLSFPDENGMFYINNPVGSLTTQFDGGTVVLTATYPVSSCNTYHIKLSIADASDQDFDSGVFLGARSFNAENILLTNYGNAIEGQNNVFEGCNNSLKVSRTGADISEPVTVPLILSGTFTNGVDVQSILGLPFPSSVTIPAGATFVDIPYSVINDGVGDNNETLIVKVLTSCPCDVASVYVTATINLHEKVVINSLNPSNSDCEGGTNGSISVNASGGSGSYLYSIDGGAIWQSLNNFTGLTAGNYTILVQDPGSCHPLVSASTTIGDPAPIIAEAGADVTICPSGSTQLSGSGGVIYSWSPAAGLNFANIANPIASPSITTTYTLTVTNANGKCASTDVVTVEVADITEPTLICPANLKLISKLENDCKYKMSAVDNFMPNVIDNCTSPGDITFTYSLSGATNSPLPVSNLAGEEFNVGITFVEVVAYDLSGNKSICTFEIEVNCADIFIEGTVVDDRILEIPNNIINGAGIDGAAANLHVTIFPTTGTIGNWQTVPVNNLGVYTFAPIPNGQYKIVLHTTPTPVLTPSPQLPTGFSSFLGEGPLGSSGVGIPNGEAIITVNSTLPTIYGKVAALVDVSFALQAAPLPVRLISFSGKSTENGNELNWNTSTEQNFSHFEIERSASSMAFEKVGEVKGTGESNYRFSDLNSNTASGSVGLYYRLKMVDLDGKFAFSKIIFIQNEMERSTVGNFYPNPALNNETNIEVASESKSMWAFTAFDTAGRILNTETRFLEKGENQVKINTANLKPGIVIYRIENEKKSAFRKILK